jgi:hypothetical protein
LLSLLPPPPLVVVAPLDIGDRHWIPVAGFDAAGGARSPPRVPFASRTSKMKIIPLQGRHIAATET